MIGEAISTCLQGTSCAYPSECYSDSNGLKCAQPSLPTGYLVGGDLFCLHAEARDWGRLLMSVHNPKLHFVTGLPDSPKTEAKGVVLVKGPWYETPGSLELPFNMNKSLVLPGLF